VGNAGQRVQGLLAKLGLTRSYACLNAWAHAVHPSRSFAERDRLDDHDQLEWRNELYDAVASLNLQAVIAFGFMAQAAVALWSGRPDVELKQIAHPSNPDEGELLNEWRDAVAELRTVVTPDDDGDNTGPKYGADFTEADYVPMEIVVGGAKPRE